MPASIHRGVVVVHGIGLQQQRDHLELMTEALARQARLALGASRVAILDRTRPDRFGVAECDIHLFSARDPLNPAEIWHVREAWWAESFKPSPISDILGWGFLGFLFTTLGTFKTDMETLGNTLKARRLRISANTLKVINNGLIYSLAYLIYLLAGLLIVPLIVLLQLPLISLIPGVAGIARRLVSLITLWPGDQQAITSRPFALASASAVVTEALRPFLDPATQGQTVQDHGYPVYLGDFRTVTLIAHSAGAVVSFNALAGPIVRQWCHQFGRRISWLTVGSGLNLAYRMRERAAPASLAFYQRRIDSHVNWLDLHATFDPVSQGSAPAKLVEALVGPGKSHDHDCPIVNRQWPLTDHNAYWANDVEAMPQMVTAILDDAKGWSPSPAPSSNVVDQAILQHAQTALAGTDDHRRSVYINRFVFMGCLIAVLQWVLWRFGWPWALLTVFFVCGLLLPLTAYFIIGFVQDLLDDFDLDTRQHWGWFTFFAFGSWLVAGGLLDVYGWSPTAGLALPSVLTSPWLSLLLLPLLPLLPLALFVVAFSLGRDYRWTAWGASATALAALLTLIFTAGHWWLGWPAATTHNAVVWVALVLTGVAWLAVVLSVWFRAVIGPQPTWPVGVRRLFLGLAACAWLAASPLTLLDQPPLDQPLPRTLLFWVVVFVVAAALLGNLCLAGGVRRTSPGTIATGGIVLAAAGGVALIVMLWTSAVALDIVALGKTIQAAWGRTVPPAQPGQSSPLGDTWLTGLLSGWPDLLRTYQETLLPGLIGLLALGLLIWSLVTLSGIVRALIRWCGDHGRFLGAVINIASGLSIALSVIALASWVAGLMLGRG